MLGFIAKSFENLIRKISSSKVDEKLINEVLNEFKKTLIEADIDIQLANNIINSIKNELKSEKLPAGLTYREYIIKLMYDKLVEILGKEKVSLIGKKKIMLVGLFGSGKTTAAAKLAKYFQKRGLKVLLVCLDYHRPAAKEQLIQLANQIHVDYLANSNAIEVAKKSLNYLQKYDAIIYDTAGRNALDKELANELKKLAEIIKPDEVLLVIPADIGKVAKKQAEEFHKLVGITGIIVTKLDSTAKGGGALAACSATNAKVKFISYGEKVDAFEEYDPKSFVSRLLGLGDLNTLLQKVKEVVKEEEKIEEFNLEVFYKQLKYLKQLGPLTQVAKLIPGVGISVPEEVLELQEAKMKKWKAIIDSMTKEERKNPKIINESRIRRIAKGSGTKEEEVRELLSTYKKVEKMIKNINKLMSDKRFQTIFKKFKLA
ncbi:MAG: signal recognition particle receptor subunit alpha [Candidatus Aenigmatarchaeota archaeon]